jgi:hypothetical protein
MKVDFSLPNDLPHKGRTQMNVDLLNNERRA